MVVISYHDESVGCVIWSYLFDLAEATGRLRGKGGVVRRKE